MQGRELELTQLIATLLESPRPLLDSSRRQSIARARTLADLNALTTVDDVPDVDHSEDIASLCVALSQSHRSNVYLRRCIQAAVAESAELRHRLTTARRSPRLGKVLPSRPPSSLTRLVSAAQAARHREDRLASAERVVATLKAGLVDRDRQIAQIMRQLADAEARHITVQGVATTYFRQF